MKEDLRKSWEVYRRHIKDLKKRGRLIVDDKPKNRRSFQDLLTELGEISNMPAVKKNKKK